MNALLCLLALPLYSVVTDTTYHLMPTVADTSAHHLTVQAEAAVGNGHHTPHYLVANRFGTLSTRPNTGTLSADYQYTRRSGQWRWEAGSEIQAAAHSYAPLFLQQAYVTATYRWLALTAGAREVLPTLRDASLSSGGTVYSGNARPVPGLRLATPHFIPVPGTRHFLYVNGQCFYGRTTDDAYAHRRFEEYASRCPDDARAFLTNEVWLHRKELYLRTKPSLPWGVTIGVEHVVQFGGHTRYATAAGVEEADYSPSLRQFFNVLWPRSGDATSAAGDQSFVYGNHVGNLNILVERHGAHHRLGFYLENLFEDGSGIRKGNGLDGLWGIEYHTDHRQALVSGVVLEYLQTTDQSGATLWSPHDYEGYPIASLMPRGTTGNDDYYNNYLYNSYTHHGLSIGSPLLPSPALNTDSYLSFTDSRIHAIHLGLEGMLTQGLFNRPQTILCYRLLLSHRTSWGTYNAPRTCKARAFSCLCEATLELGSQRHLTAAYAFDEGRLTGAAHAFYLSAAYTLNLGTHPSR